MPGVSHQGQGEGKGPLPQSAGDTMSSLAWEVVGFLCCEGLSLALGEPGIHHPPGLFLQSFFSAGPGAWGYSSPGAGLCTSLCRTSQVPVSPFLGLSRSF